MHLKWFVWLQAAQGLLRRAFSEPGSRPMDIFGVAAALAEGMTSLTCILLCAPQPVCTYAVPSNIVAKATSTL